MQMDEAAFTSEADKTLKSLLEVLERKSAEGDFDLEETAEGITIEFADGRQMLVTKHSISKQLWVSSPLSGASHYQFKDGVWHNTRGGKTLTDLVMEDTATLAAAP